MQKGDQAKELSVAVAFYFQAICAIETSQMHIKGLLLKAICYLKSAKLLLEEETDNKDDLRNAQLNLEAVLEQTLDPANKEADQCRFISLLGSACLALYIHTEQEAFLNQAKILFGKAAKRLDREAPRTLSSLKLPDPLRYKTALGLALSHFYQVRDIFCSPSTAKTRPLLQHLQASRSRLEEALALQEGGQMSYMLALNHALTAYSIEQEKKKEESLALVGYLNQKSLEHLNIAIKILDAIAIKAPDVLKLLGIVKYKLAFGCSDHLNHLSIDFEAGVQAQNYLSEVYETLPEVDPILLFCLGDCTRQLAWLSQLPFFKSIALRYLEEASSSDDIFAEALFLIFTTQNDLFKLIEVSSKTQGIDKETMTHLCESLFLLKSMLMKKSENTLFTLVKEPLKREVALLEQAHLQLTLSSQNEAEKYAGTALKIGDALNKIYVSVLFNHALMERCRVFDFGLELEQDL
jgi:hypothetical protein